MGTVEENKALIYKLYDEYNKGNYDFYDECFSDDFIAYRPNATLDKAGYKEFLIYIWQEVSKVEPRFNPIFPAVVPFCN